VGVRENRASLHEEGAKQGARVGHKKAMTCTESRGDRLLAVIGSNGRTGGLLFHLRQNLKPKRRPTLTRTFRRGGVGGHGGDTEGGI